MKKPAFLLLYVFTLSRMLLAATPDSLVFIDELNWHSKTEEAAFRQLSEKEHIDYFPFAWFSNGDTNWVDAQNALKTLDDFAAHLRTAGFERAKPAKKVKLVYRSVHDAFFKKYELNPDFDQIFKEGIYNCATASFLYAEIFQRLDIPVSIKLSQDHVYLIAYPDAEQVVVETTNPYRGLFIVDEDTKKKYVDFLAESKLISPEEYDSLSVDTLFHQFYLLQKDVNLQQLSGVLYYNHAILHIENESYDEALDDIRKAYYLFPSNQISFLYFGVSSMLLYQCDFSDLSCAPYLSQLTRFGNKGLVTEIADEVFGNATYAMLIEKGNMKLYDDFYLLLKNNISDTAILDQLAFSYNYERGRVLYNQQKYPEALQNFEICLELKPNHAEALPLFTNTLVNTLWEMSDQETVAEQIDAYIQRFPNLADNRLLMKAKNYALLRLADLRLMDNNMKEAQQFLDRFESNYTPDFYMDKTMEIIIIDVYSKMASYYFSKGYTSRAAQYIDKGLEYVPGSYELKYKKKALR